MTKGLGASAHLSRAGCINGTGILTQGSVVHTQARPWQDGVRELKVQDKKGSKYLRTKQSATVLSCLTVSTEVP